MQNVARNSLFVLAILGVGFLVSLHAERVSAQPSSISVESTAVATTSISYVGNGVATSTWQLDSYPAYSSSKVFSMAGIDSEYLYVIAIASSTATVYNFTPQISNNGTDWYPIGSTGTASALGIITVASTTTYSWTPSTTATTTVEFKLPDTASLHERIVVSATGAAGSYYAEVVLKKNASGQ